MKARLWWYCMSILSLIGYLSVSVATSIGDAIASNNSVKKCENLRSTICFEFISYGLFGFIGLQLSLFYSNSVPIAYYMLIIVGLLLDIALITIFCRQDTFKFVVMTQELSKPRYFSLEAGRLDIKSCSKAKVASSELLSLSAHSNQLMTDISKQFVDADKVGLSDGLYSIAESDRWQATGALSQIKINAQITGAIVAGFIEKIFHYNDEHKNKIQDDNKEDEKSVCQDTISKQQTRINSNQLSNQTSQQQRNVFTRSDSMRSTVAAELQSQWFCDNNKSFRSIKSPDVEISDIEVDSCDTKDTTNNKPSATSFIVITENQNSFELETQDLHPFLFKTTIAKRWDFFAWLLAFWISGILTSIHILTFALGLSKHCQNQNIETLTVLSFAFAPQVLLQSIPYDIVPKLENKIVIYCSCLLAHAIRYLFYALALDYVSPYFVIPLELSLSLSRLLDQRLISILALDISSDACESLPKIIYNSKFSSTDINLDAIKMSLRCSFQSCLVATNTTIGATTGVLLAGLILNQNNDSFAQLWLCCAAISIATILLIGADRCIKI